MKIVLVAANVAAITDSSWQEPFRVETLRFALQSYSAGCKDCWNLAVLAFQRAAVFEHVAEVIEAAPLCSMG